VQNKAPIRSQTLGPATLGERRIQSTGQREGSAASRRLGQTGTTFKAYFGLSVIGIARGAHRRLHVCLAAAAPERNRRILGEFNRSSQHPEIRELQWQQQNMVAVDVEFVRR
jgi:hypothetical protein